ncbi:MAG: NADH-quinone oxidoreductase subunit F, partial [bacterium]
MEKLHSIKDLQELQEHLLGWRDPNIPTVVIPSGTCAQASGANELVRTAKQEIFNKELTKKVHLRVTGCHGFCQMEPSVLIEPDRIFYPKIKVEEMARVIDAVARRETLEDLVFHDPKTNLPLSRQEELPFFKKQVRSILGRNERIDPTRIEDYIENGGYSAVAWALAKKNPRWVVEEVKTSGLRGRGGAGFPTGLKWELLAKQPNGSGKFVVCNADEGDPGAYMDRSVLEGNPHSIIEGMLIGAFATGATEGIIYIRNEYPLA